MNELSELLKTQGAALVGFADLSRVDEETRRGFPRAVSFCMILTPRIVADIRQGPTEKYFEEYKRLNALLTELAQVGADFLVAQGHGAAPLKSTGDWGEGFRAPFQHKTAARLAGLGWIGKCALLVTPEHGPAIRWNTVLTDAPLPVAPAPLEPACGPRTVCVDLCPGQAASGTLWREGMAREDFFDPEACLRGTKQITAQRSVNSPICGLCVANCPFTLAHLERVGAI